MNLNITTCVSYNISSDDDGHVKYLNDVQYTGAGVIRANFAYIDAVINQLKTANTNLVAQNTALNSQITELNRNLNITKNDVVVCNASVTRTDAQLGEVKLKLEEHNVKITDDNKKITDNYTEQTTNLTNVKTELVSKIEEVKINIITNNTLIENLKIQITDLGEKIACILESTKNFVRRTSGQFARMVGMTKALDDDYKFGEIMDQKN